MSAAGSAWHWIFTVPPGRRSAWQVVLWWELRRGPVNLVVGGVGIVSLVCFFVFISVSGALKPGEDAVEPLALMAAPVVLNICYTFGWLVEAAVNSAACRGSGMLGPKLLKIGTSFSLAVVLLPSVFWGIAVVLKWLGS